MTLLTGYYLIMWNWKLNLIFFIYLFEFHSFIYLNFLLIQGKNIILRCRKCWKKSPSESQFFLFLLIRSKFRYNFCFINSVLFLFSHLYFLFIMYCLGIRIVSLIFFCFQPSSLYSKVWVWFGLCLYLPLIKESNLIITISNIILDNELMKYQSVASWTCLNFIWFFE